MRLAFFVILWVGLLYPPPVHAVKIGYVNLRYAMQNVRDGMLARERLKRMKAKYQKALDSAKDKVESARKLYLQRKDLLRGPAKQREETKLQKLLITTQQTYQALMQKLSYAEKREMQIILNKMRAILQTIIQDHNIELMLEKSGSSLLYAPKSLDYTKELIKRYEKAFGGKSKAKTPRKRRKR